MPRPRIVYEDVAPGASKATQVSVTDRQAWCDHSQIVEAITPPKVATLEHNFWKLEDSFKFFPDAPESETFGWWTEMLSDVDGLFAAQPVLELTLSGTYTSVGLTFTFDTIGPTWPTWMNVKWYRGESLLADQDFFPNACHYSAIREVHRFDRLVITFDRMSQGYRYLKLESAIYGIVRTFESDEVSNIAIYEGVSLISEELEVGDATFSVRNLSTIPFNFLRKQTLYLYLGDDLLGVRFITKHEQLDTNHFNVTAQSFLGLLSDGSDHYGGMYEGTLSEMVIADILGDIVPYELDTVLKGIPVSGWLPKDSRLNNLARVLFAIGGCVSALGAEVLRIFRPALPVAGEVPVTLAGRSRENPRLVTDKAVTAVEITAHTFTAGAESVELYNAALSGTTTVDFSEPMANLAISGGEIITSGVNYAEISGTGGKVILTGVGYTHTSCVIRKTNSLVESNTIPNVKKCQDNYLVTPDNVQDVLERYFDYYQRNSYVLTTVTLEGDDMGELVQLENGFHGPRLGNIATMDLTVSKKVLAELKVVLAADEE